MTTDTSPTVVLVHGAFAESGSWNGVIAKLHEAGLRTVAVANPLRSLDTDAAYLAHVLAGITEPVVLVAHSYGGMLTTEAAATPSTVAALVYVAAFAPDTGESGLSLSNQFPGSSLGDTLSSIPLGDGINDLTIEQDRYRAQFMADVDEADAALDAATQRPVTDKALSDGLQSERPAWKILPSWFVFGELDRNIPVEAHRFSARRADARSTVEVAGASHSVGVSHPDEVARVILDAVSAVSAVSAVRAD
jgi:pimeloyl-ACP methyl ester carboxylesterase